jgi:hypothetical protein
MSCILENQISSSCSHLTCRFKGIPKDVHRNFGGIFSCVGCLSRMIKSYKKIHYDSFALYFKGNFIHSNHITHSILCLSYSCISQFVNNRGLTCPMKFLRTKAKRTLGETRKVNLPISNLLTIIVAYGEYVHSTFKESADVIPGIKKGPFPQTRIWSCI